MGVHIQIGRPPPSPAQVPTREHRTQSGGTSSSITGSFPSEATHACDDTSAQACGVSLRQHALDGAPVWGLRVRSASADQTPILPPKEACTYPTPAVITSCRRKAMPSAHRQTKSQSSRIHSSSAAWCCFTHRPKKANLPGYSLNGPGLPYSPHVGGEPYVFSLVPVIYDTVLAHLF
jgi:hypothetical protein